MQQWRQAAVAMAEQRQRELAGKQLPIVFK